MVKNLNFRPIILTRQTISENWQLLSYPGAERLKIRTFDKNLNATPFFFFFFLLLPNFMIPRLGMVKNLKFGPTISVRLKILKILIFIVPRCRVVRTQHFKTAQHFDFCVFS